MFIDASALIAIVGREDDWQALAAKLDAADVSFVSPLSVWESTQGLCRKFAMPAEEAERVVRSFVEANRAAMTVIDGEIGNEAMRANRMFGKGRHPAALNFGDCFAYACAKVLNVPLLAKGNDFPQTDIELA
jgi:ribonuclease VapC